MEATQTECPYCVKYRKYLEKKRLYREEQKDQINEKRRVIYYEKKLCTPNEIRQYTKYKDHDEARLAKNAKQREKYKLKQEKIKQLLNNGSEKEEEEQKSD